ncbi:MAG: hypothetical protein ABIT68_01230 [Sphingomicrobium sp.]
MLAGFAIGGAALLLLAAAARPTALSETIPGLWEMSGVPNSGAPVRQCVADTAMLAHVEHRGSSCTQVVIKDMPTWSLIHYTCSNGGFGESKMSLLTPRSLRIETQGISDNFPFNYVVQARRVGDCPAKIAAH